jgi:hypothetical protein
MRTTLRTKCFFLPQNRDVPYKTLLLSIDDSAAFIVEEMLEKYGKDRREAPRYCLAQVTTMAVSTAAAGDAPSASRETYLDDDECPLAILMSHVASRGQSNNPFTRTFLSLCAFFLCNLRVCR